MSIRLDGFEEKTQDAVRAFWGNREAARLKQQEAGKLDQGERSSVTAGKNMDGFITLIVDLIRANGLTGAEFYLSRALVVLPGYFRPTKLWDLVVVNNKRLIAAIEVKSHVGPSFGNNFNNRTGEAIGTAHCFWTAYREGAFGDQPRPFVGWLMVVEDALKSRRPVNDRSPHFSILPEFRGASYLHRYDLLCQRLMKEQLYTSASVLATPREAISSGEYKSLSELTSLTTFVTALAGHAATEAARLELS